MSINGNVITTIHDLSLTCSYKWLFKIKSNTLTIVIRVQFVLPVCFVEVNTARAEINLGDLLSFSIRLATSVTQGFQRFKDFFATCKLFCKIARTRYAVCSRWINLQYFLLQFFLTARFKKKTNGLDYIYSLP